MHNAFMQRKKNFIYRFGELCIHCPIHTEFLCTTGVLPSFFVSLPPKILIKSNQTFQIIERIYTAPYLLFIIIINYYSFYKRKS